MRREAPPSIHFLETETLAQLIPEAQTQQQQYGAPQNGNEFAFLLDDSSLLPFLPSPSPIGHNFALVSWDLFNNTNSELSAPTQPTLQSKQAVMCKEREDEEFDPNREWSTVLKNGLYFKEGDDIKISSKTRCEKPCFSVPEKIYSSLKYEVIQQTTFGTALPFLHSRISAVEAGTFAEIKKEKPVLKGTVEGALTHPPANKHIDPSRLTGNLKVQFNSEVQLSFHHFRKEICWEIAYFEPSDLHTPILIKRSAPFKVFARKPSTASEKESKQPNQPAPVKKRAREDKVTAPALPCKIAKTASSCALNSQAQQQHLTTQRKDSYAEFESRLNDLMLSFCDTLGPMEKKQALQHVFNRLLAADASSQQQGACNSNHSVLLDPAALYATQNQVDETLLLEQLANSPTAGFATDTDFFTSLLNGNPDV